MEARRVDKAADTFNNLTDICLAAAATFIRPCEASRDWVCAWAGVDFNYALYTVIKYKHFGLIKPQTLQLQFPFSLSLPTFLYLFLSLSISLCVGLAFFDNSKRCQNTQRVQITHRAAEKR